MAISGIDLSHSSAPTSQPGIPGANVFKNAADIDTLSKNDATPSTIVTLGSGNVAEVSVYSGKLSSVPMSSASAPELFVQADSDGNGSLSREEFARQLKRVGADDAKATALFDSFNTSKNAELTLDDYVKTVTSSDTDTRNLFQSLFASYTTDESGNFSIQEFANFKSQGAAVAAEYWHAHPGLQQRPSET
jgi:hypothetical protein